MLHGSICPVTATIAIAGVAAATLFARKSDTRPSASRFALVSGTVFALQMLNYPIGGGLSGHALGGLLASSLLGTPFGILSVSLVLLLQTLLFADGGLLMLGANTLNMALIGAGLGGALHARLQAHVGRSVSLVASAGLSVMAAVGALVAELSAAGVGSSVLYTSLAIHHIPVALGEGLVTLLLYRLLSAVPLTDAAKGASPVARSAAWTVYGALLIGALLLAPLASASPDALEGTLSSFHLLPDAPNFAHAPWADYQFTADGGYLSTFLAALAGLGATLLSAMLLRRAISRA
ncbi:hypothetical protein N425_11390 [Tannerella sp. oral taxon BU063 isolate Cell 2]|uniref:Cobalamin biosynthesis protein CbiM n=1 Tax=Tannerella sp. oral taxon BU063 isolate Cell 2 TaxID=1411148 RepID=W2C415_9BACT|nr:hypothetical protein N425_11390 [Tannerella sp. oral taxon BU063 isolate Cell 2]